MAFLRKNGQNAVCRPQSPVVLYRARAAVPAGEYGCNMVPDFEVFLLGQLWPQPYLNEGAFTSVRSMKLFEVDI